MSDQPNLMDSGVLDEVNAEAQAEGQEDEVLTQIATYIDSLQSSLASMQVGLRIMNNRIGTLEKYVSYLLTKDPEASVKIKELAQKEAAEGKGES